MSKNLDFAQVLTACIMAAKQGKYIQFRASDHVLAVNPWLAYTISMPGRYHLQSNYHSFKFISFMEYISKKTPFIR